MQLPEKTWDTSETREAFASQFHPLLSESGHGENVKRLVCFALGDLHIGLAQLTQSSESPDSSKTEAEHHLDNLTGKFTQHAVALIMAGLANCLVGNSGVRLLTQDPAYNDGARNMLKDLGFEVVGDHGVGGFAEIDKSVVFSVFPTVSVK